MYTFYVIKRIIHRVGSLLEVYTVSMQFANMNALRKSLSNYANTMHLGILVSDFSFAFWQVQHH